MSCSSEPVVANVDPLSPYPRQGYVYRGREIDLLTNLFQLKTREIKLYEYRVDFHELRPVRLKGGRGRGRGRGRGGPPRGQSEPPQEIEIKERELKRRAFWTAVDRTGLFWEFVFDDHNSAWSQKNILGGSSTVSEVVDVKNSEEKDVRVRVTLVPLCFPYFFDLGNEHHGTVDSCQKFMKNLLTQRARLPLEFSSSQNPVCSKWQTAASSIYAVPGKFEFLDRKDYEIKITPGIRAWVGLYASIRQMEDTSPIVNWALANRLFYTLDMDLLTFYIEILQEASLVSKKNWREDLDMLKKCGMDRRQRDLLRNKIEGLHVKAGGIDTNGVHRPAALIPDKNDFSHLNNNFGQRGTYTSRRKSENTVYIPADNNERFEFPLLKKVYDNGAKQGTLALSERHFKITGVADESAVTFRTLRGTLQEEYNRARQALSFPFLPLIEVQLGKDKCYVPMEVLYIHRTQSYVKKLDFFTRKAFIMGVCRNPTKYKKLTDHLVSEVGLDNNGFLENFKVDFNPRMIECKGMVLDSPRLRDGEGKEVEVVEPIRFYRSLVLNEPIKETIVFVVVILVGPQEGKQVIPLKYAGKFYKRLVTRLEERGLKIDSEEPQVHKEVQMYSDDSKLGFPEFDRVPADLGRSYKSSSEHFTLSKVIHIEKAKMEVRPDASSKKLVFLIFNDRAFDFYGRIKTICEGERHVVGQVIDQRTVFTVIDNEANAIKGGKNPDYKVFFSLATKINGKLGGLNIYADHPQSVVGLDNFDLNKTMYIGIDVTHPAPHDHDEMDISIASMVASMDNQGSIYKYEIYAQMKAKETVECFDRQFKNLMLSFHEANGFFAEHVIVFRDGISDSEMLQTGATEMEWMKASWETLIKDPHHPSQICAALPTFTYIVVQKRHGTRFFSPVVGKEGCYENMPSGTTIDRKVVSPTQFDIWLASHHGEIGTSKPAHYYILHDELRFKAQQICDITYRLCFLSARCRKPVSIPIPVNYAHLACEKAREKYKSLIRDDRIQETDSVRRKNEIERLLQDYTTSGMSFI